MHHLLLVVDYVGIVISVDTERSPHVGSCFNVRDKVLTKNDRVVALRIPEIAYALNMTFPLRMPDLLTNTAELYKKFSMFGAVEVVGDLACVDFQPELQKYLGKDLSLVYPRKVRVINAPVSEDSFVPEKILKKESY